MSDQEQITKRTPNLFVVGVQKCGTTLLCKYLEKHQSIIHSRPKEPFDLLKEMTPDKFRQYLKEKFPDVGEKKYQYVVDGSTTYFQSERALQNITTYCGRDVKIIVLMRNPVHRAISHFFHDIKKGRGGIRSSILDEYYINKSSYARHLRRWQECMGESNIIMLRYEDLKENLNLFMNSAFQRIGLEPPAMKAQRHVNVGWKVFRSSNMLRVSESDEHAVPFREVNELHGILADDIVETGRLTGWDVSDWLEPIPASYWKEQS